MVKHTCPVCHCDHEVRAARDAVAYGRQLTCSPDCESVRRRQMRAVPPQLPAESRPGVAALTPRPPEVARVLHAWVTVRAAADMIRARSALQALGARRR
jgi:hypothetical protein